MSRSQEAEPRGDASPDARESARREMVERIERHFAETADETSVSRISDALREAMLRVPRHRFVPPEVERLAYADSALPIGCRQTISQPFIVALMIELAGLERGSRVLEVGTGSGYQAAVLASLVDRVHTIERVRELAERSARCLSELECDRVEVRCADGFEGWPEAAPFDAILVTACSREIPAPLVEQLAVGGRMVIPVGAPNAYQELRVIEKQPSGEIVERHVLPVAFVPLIREDDDAVEPGGGTT